MSQHVDELAETEPFLSIVIPANPGSGPGQAPESRKFRVFWMPDRVRHDEFEPWYDAINIYLLHNIQGAVE